jgi:anaerobic selenocysteine-containing dehydrogenase
MVKTACGLDCPDACGIITDPSHFPKIVADPAHPTSNGTLCSLLNRYLHEEPRITTPRVNNSETTLDKALDAVAQALQAKEKLLWRGSGNFGVMQEVTNLLFDAIHGTTTKGSLCDGAGDAGIIEGRGVNRILPPEQIAKAEVVIVWGKNLTITASHLMPYIKGKKLVVIDPIQTPIAKQADLFIQIKPRSDFYMATMLARFAFMGDHEQRAYLDEFASEHEDFYDFTRGFRVKAVLEHIGIDLNQMGELLEYLTEDKVVFLVGNGVQKYSIGNFVLQAIDALAVTLGHFGKEGAGVAFLGNSKLGFTNPFETKGKKVQKATTKFGDFETVLIQGGNPVASMPHSKRVIEELKKSKTVIYFGLYDNETSALADIVIPAKNFFEKEDIRLSYAHHTIAKMQKVYDIGYGISEYDFTNTLLQKLKQDKLKEESHYINLWLEQCQQQDDHYLSPAHQAIPYANGFGEEDDEFEFIEDFYDDFESTKRLTKIRRNNKKNEPITEFWLVTPKAKNALNTQFKRDNQIILHPTLGFDEGESVTVSSPYGSHQFIVKNSTSMRADTVLIYANVVGVNYLTPSILSEEGDGACYQEVKVRLNA